MSYLGQSQTPWEVDVSEVDLPARHNHRWGHGLGQIPNPLDVVSSIVSSVVPRAAPVAPREKTTQEKLMDALPYIVGGAVVLGGAVYIMRQRRK